MLHFLITFFLDAYSADDVNLSWFKIPAELEPNFKLAGHHLIRITEKKVRARYETGSK